MTSLYDTFDPPTVYFDLGPVPIVNTAVTAETFRAFTLFLTNTTAGDLTITITNTAGTVLCQDLPVPANTPLPLLQFAGMKIAGLKWIASAAGLNGQIEGVPDA